MPCDLLSNAFASDRNNPRPSDWQSQGAFRSSPLKVRLSISTSRWYAAQVVRMLPGLHESGSRGGMRFEAVGLAMDRA